MYFILRLFLFRLMHYQLNYMIYIVVKSSYKKNEMNRALGHLCAHIG